MSVYQSDKEQNRKIVSTSLKLQDGSYKDESRIQSSYDVKDHLLELAKNVATRRDVLPYALEYKNELAIWKAISLSGSWMSFITDLQLTKLTVREITILKQIVDQEFIQLLDDAIADGVTDRSDKTIVIEGARSAVTAYGAKGLTITIELL